MQHRQNKSKLHREPDTLYTIRTYTFVFLEPSSLTIVVSQPDKRHVMRTVLCWSCMTNPEHNRSYENKRYTLLTGMASLAVQEELRMQGMQPHPRVNFLLGKID